MKNLNYYVLKEVYNTGFDLLTPILRKTGWPELSIDGDIAKSIDEDTTIEFRIDEDDNKPYISKIVCNFHTSDPAHLRDLNGLVEIYKEINKL